MEARRGGGGGAGHPGVYRLVPLPVLELRLDIGRQGHPAQALQHLQEDALVGEADQAVAPLRLAHDLRRQLSAEGDPSAGAQLLSGTDQALPGVLPPVDEQQDLAGPAQGSVRPDAAA